MITTKKLNSILIPTTLIVSSLLTFLSNNMDINSNLIGIILTIFGSVFVSWSTIYLLTGNIVKFIWNKKYSRYYIHGKWYVIYYGSEPTQNYIRVGALEFNQTFNEVKMSNLNTRNAVIENNSVYGFIEENKANVQGQKTSIGKGNYFINFENASMKGFYNMIRFEPEKSTDIEGFNRLFINEPYNKSKKPQKITGNFYNAEKNIDPKRPSSGLVAIFKHKEEAETFAKNLAQRHQN